MEMKKIVWLWSALMLTACGTRVEVSNPLDMARDNETVEVPWTDVQERLPKATPENIVVLSPDGEQQPSQVLYNGGTEPQVLIFQATVAGNASKTYRLRVGEREDYPSLVYGRAVPERMDDFAWENNLMAYRVYGPALEAIVTRWDGPWEPVPWRRTKGVSCGSGIITCRVGFWIAAQYGFRSNWIMRRLPWIA